jgi:hypothetical protein
MLVPVEAPDLFDRVEFWSTSRAGFDFSSTRVLAANTGYQVDFTAENVCGAVARIAGIDLNHATTEPFHGEATVPVTRSGMMHGLGGWFVAQLAEGITITNSPLTAERIQRRQIYFPLDRAVRVMGGDLVRIRMTVRPTDSVVNWNVDVLDGRSGAKRDCFRHSTWKGMLLPSEDLARTRPGYKPKLVPRGEARRTVVNLCDGIRTLTEIEQEVFRLYPNLFRTSDEAAAFVAEVVTRYTE